MITTNATCMLVDIEGTTSAIQYVYDVLFPYARKELNLYLKANWQKKDVQDAGAILAQDLGHESVAQWLERKHSSPDVNKTSDFDMNQTGVVAVDQNCVADPDREQDRLIEQKQRQLVEEEVLRLMDADIKSTGLKALQGMIWAEGYAAGKLTSHVFADVPAALKSWNEAGLDVRIFSSGSVTAQKVFFQNTEYGDLGKFISANYDTTTGAKREAKSYQIIAEHIGLPATSILFLSDIEQELDAAKEAGMQVALVVRPGNAPTDGKKFPAINSFDQIRLN